MIIKSRNLLDLSTPTTYLSNAVTAGTTSSAVRNTAGFVNQYAVQIGRTAEEQSEIVIGTVTSGSALSHPALSFNHPTDTPVYLIKYDKVVFERSTAGTAGTATPIGTASYQVDNQGTVTPFEDTSGASTYAYRTRFLNSVTLGSTSQSDWITQAGFSFYSLASIRGRIKEKLWNSGYIKDDRTYDNWINEWKDEMSNAVVMVNQDYSLGTVDVAFGTNGYGTITTGDFSQVRRFEVTTDGNSYYLSTKMRTNEYSPNQTFSSAQPYHNWLGDTVFQIHPSDSAGTARITFYRFGTTLVNDTDELPQVMRSWTKSFVDYGLSNALAKDGKVAEAKLKLEEALAVKNTFVANIVPHDQTGPTFISLTEPISGDEAMF